MTAWIRWGVAAAALGLWGGPEAAAQKAKETPQAPQKAKEAPKTAQKERRAPGKVIKLQADIIEGRVQKPEAFYVLQRTSMSFEGLKLTTRLVPKILEALKKPPF